MRRPDWPSRLAAYIEATQGEPFAWGVNDCCLWACGGVAAMTGLDPAAALRGRYDSLAGAMTLLTAQGFDTLEAAVRALAAEAGFVEISPLKAKRGDLVLAAARDPDSGLGLCGGRVALFLTPQGIVSLQLVRAVTAWSVE